MLKREIINNDIYCIYTGCSVKTVTTLKEKFLRLFRNENSNTKMLSGYNNFLM